jgi:hypothetical protein
MIRDLNEMEYEELTILGIMAVKLTILAVLSFNLILEFSYALFQAACTFIKQYFVIFIIFIIFIRNC